MAREALGLIETKGLIAAIEATDAASKAAAVTVTSVELTDAALLTIKLEGELGAVQAAVEAGARAAERVGELIAAWIIPRPDDGLGPILPPRRYVSKYHPDDNRPLVDTPQKPAEKRAPSAPVKTEGPSAARPKAAPVKSSSKAVAEIPVKLPVAEPVATRDGQPMENATLAQLEEMSVVTLRQYARNVEGLPLKGRQISMANKEQLLDAIKRVKNLD